ncbi:MAG TPA: histidine phosphatase family protein [Candidatus Dormibacteraeota bacterium]|jgi:broad specificity phosphatase PhoE
MSIPGSRATPPDPPGSRPPDPTRLFLVRHGQSTWNDSRRIQGQLDPPLSALGEMQARRLAERLSGRLFDGFYSSDLARARDTALTLSAEIGMVPVALPDLREIALGEWEGLTREEMISGYPEEWSRWEREPSWDLVPGSEGAAAFEARVQQVLDELLERHRHGDILVVTHGGVIQVALGRTIGNRSHGLFPFVIDNCSISILTQGRARTVISGVNDVSHLHDGAVAASARRDRSGGLTQQY